MTEHAEPETEVSPSGDPVPTPDTEPAEMPTEVEGPPTAVHAEAVPVPEVHEATVEEADAGPLPPPVDPYVPPVGTGPSSAAATIARDRPEVAIGAAFGIGFVIAMILKRLASR